jgi:SAP domain-containing ribonucleoprotein
MADYAKMKNADLEALLKSRGLTTGGKKADMVDRLTKDDEKKKKEAKAPVAAAEDEDEIDWDDDEPIKPAESEVASKPAAASTAAATAAKATTQPATAAIKAGGQGPVANPTAVPNQVSDIDPSMTKDLTVKSPAESAAKTETGDKKAEKKEEPPANFSRGLPPTDLEKEIEKRKARAKKFGLNIEDDETLKKLERAKKFGETAPPKGLDEALPERPHKRGREGDDDNGRNKRRGHGGRFRGRGRGGPRGGDRRPDERREPRSNAGGAETWMSEADRAKAEARKNRFAAQPASN